MMLNRKILFTTDFRYIIYNKRNSEIYSLDLIFFFQHKYSITHILLCWQIINKLLLQHHQQTSVSIIIHIFLIIVILQSPNMLLQFPQTWHLSFSSSSSTINIFIFIIWNWRRLIVRIFGPTVWTIFWIGSLISSCICRAK